MKKNDIIYAILLTEDGRIIPTASTTVSGVSRVETVRMLGIG